MDKKPEPKTTDPVVEVAETPETVSPKSNKDLKKYVPLAGVSVVVGLALLGGYLYLQRGKTLNNEIAPEVQDTPLTKPTPAPLQAPTTLPSKPSLPSITDTAIENQKLYTNPQLGISFKFPEKIDGDKIDVKEVGNKIYVYNTAFPYNQGQYVEVFQKTPVDTLEVAIQKQLLGNISKDDCFVKDAKPDNAANYPDNFKVKTLGYPVDEDSDVPAFAQDNDCPSPYAESNGLSYFLGDTLHPKIFLFFSIGQQAFVVDEKTSKTWQDTIEFLN